MINLINCLNKFKFQIGNSLSIPIITNFSNTPLPKIIQRTAIVDIKSIKKTQIKFSIKVIVHRKLGHEACLKLTGNLIKLLYSIKDFEIIDFQTMPLGFDSNSQTLFQETQATVKDLELTSEPNLTFGSETLTPLNDTVLKIERQIISPGANLSNLQFIDYQKPIKKIEGSAKTNLNQFNKLLETLKAKTIATLSFNCHIFNATLMELTLNSNNLLHFKFLEVVNEI